jgi:nitrite reductase/ring-hydroxylating ferredoxin subunit
LNDSTKMDADSNARQVRIAAQSDIAKGNGKGFRVGGLEFAVFHTEEGFFATGNLCSHEHEPLAEGWVEGDKVECPRHGAQFDLRTGEALTLPASDPIEVFPLEIKGEDIFVAIPASYLNTPENENAS